MADNPVLQWNEEKIPAVLTLEVASDILAFVNDVLEERKVEVYFSMVPSQKGGLEICFHEKEE